MSDLKDLFVSKVRVKLIQTFLGQPAEMFYVRQLVRQTGEEINAVRRELEKLEQVGILKKEPRGNRVYYWVRRDHPFYGDLLSIAAKTMGLGAELIKNRNKIGKVNSIMFSGGFVRRQPKKHEDDIDILVVGDIVLPELATLIRTEESKRGKEINYTVMSREEFEFRKKRRDPFLQGILSYGRVMVVGDEEDLVS